MGGQGPASSRALLAPPLHTFWRCPPSPQRPASLPHPLPCRQLQGIQHFAPGSARSLRLPLSAHSQCQGSPPARANSSPGRWSPCGPTRTCLPSGSRIRQVRGEPVLEASTCALGRDRLQIQFLRISPRAPKGHSSALQKCKDKAGRPPPGVCRVAALFLLSARHRSQAQGSRPCHLLFAWVQKVGVPGVAVARATGAGR